MSATEQSTAKKLMPLWIGLGVLVALIASGVCIWLYGGGQYSGARLKEVNNDDVTWSGAPENYSPTNFFPYMKINLSGEEDKLMEPEFEVTTPFDEKDNSRVIWDETTSSYYQLDEGNTQNKWISGGGGMLAGAGGGGMPGGAGGAGGGGMPGGAGGAGGGGMPSSNSGADAGTATDSNGTELTARIVEYDEDENKICEVLVINGKLHGPGYIWDSDGRLLHKAEFKRGKFTGTSTIKTYDSDGNEVYVRKLWWNDTPKLIKEQVYRNGIILWELHWLNTGKTSILKRWINWKFKKAYDKEGGDVITPVNRMKCVELIEISHSYQKLKMEEKNIHGLPKEKNTGFAELRGVGEDGTKDYKKGVEPPTYGEIKEYFADTPWEKAFLEKMEKHSLNDEDSPFQLDEEDDDGGGLP